MEYFFPWCCWEGKARTLTFIERLLCKEALSQVFTDIIRYNNHSNPVKYYRSFTDKEAKSCFPVSQVLCLWKWETSLWSLLN